jgi:polar amino acid transport system substrate-binding protein
MITAGALACATGCGAGATVDGVPLVDKGLLTVCTHLPYAPFEFLRGGSVVGFDVSMMDLVARRLGVRVKVVDTRFSAITSGTALNAGRCDVAAAGMTINASRARAVDFSIPYFTVTQVLLARKGGGVTTLAQASARHLPIGVMAGTTSEEYVRSHGIADDSFEDSATVLNALRTGEVDAVVQDDPVVQYWLADPANSGLEVVQNLHTGERYGFAVRRGHAGALLRLINAVVRQSEEDGAYSSLHQTWMGGAPSPTATPAG